MKGFVVSDAAVGEVIGPAGAGKSALVAAINALTPRGGEAGFSVWRQPRRRLAATAWRLLPEWFRLHRDARDFDFGEMRRLVRLETLYRTVAAGERFPLRAAEDECGARLLLMDEGVIFALAKMRVERGEFPRWIDDERLRLRSRWGKILKIVIWLDAPNEVLIRRIRCRLKGHRMKFQTDELIGRFIDDYRAAYQEVLAEMSPLSDFKLRRFDTQENSPEEIVRRLSAENLRLEASQVPNMNKEFEFYERY